MIVRLLIPLIALLANATLQKLQVERLPDMSVPRSFPTMVVSPDGSIYALGGYTTGFVPLSSAEVFRDGKWRALPPMRYPHAGAFSVTLEDGRVVVGGGSAEAFGIGQTLGVEMFDPVSETFDPLGIMPGRRALSSAVMLKDSTVVVSGNWYASDNIVLYTADGEFSIFKPVTEERSAPLLFPTEDGDVLVFGGTDTRGEYLSGWVDCLKGDSFKPELFEEYLPYVLRPASSNGYALGGGSYLFPVMRRSDGQIAIARVQGKEFSLLPTDEPISMALPDGAQIYWDRLLVDRARRKAYMTGLSEGHGCAVLVVDYDQALDGGEAKLSLLFAPEEDGPFPYESRSILLRPGQIALVGGRMEVSCMWTTLKMFRPGMASRGLGYLFPAFLPVLCWCLLFVVESLPRPLQNRHGLTFFPVSSHLWKKAGSTSVRISVCQMWLQNWAPMRRMYRHA